MNAPKYKLNRNTAALWRIILEAAIGYQEANGMAPSYRDLAELTYFPTSTIAYHLKKMAGRGYVELASVNRGLKITQEGYQFFGRAPVR